MKEKIDKNNQQKESVIYQVKSGKIEFRGDFKRDTIWGTQKQITDLFDVDRTVITRHINNILKDKEVKEKSNVQKMHIAKSDKPVKLYSLDIILAVGYRTNSSSVKDIHKSGLDKVFEFAMIIVVNLTAFLCFGKRRQFFYI